MVTYYIHHVNKTGADVVLFTTFDVSKAMQFCSYNTQQSQKIGLRDNYYFVGCLVTF